LGKPEGKRLLGIPTCLYDNDIKMDIKKLDFKIRIGFKRLREGLL
jgi:hypothetical protein